MENLTQRIKRISQKVSKTRNKQIGNIRFEEGIYNQIVEIAKDLDITKQYLIEQIVKDFLIKD